MAESNIAVNEGVTIKYATVSWFDYLLLFLYSQFVFSIIHIHAQQQDKESHC